MGDVRCAIHYVPEAYEGNQPRVVGRQSAGAGFLDAWVRDAGAAEQLCLSPSREHFEDFRRRVGAVDPTARCTWVEPHDLAALGRAGCLYEPGPILAESAWLRRYGDERAFSICGITHSVSTERAVRGIRDHLTAPTQAWDALICTSRCVSASVDRIHESWSRYLGARRFVVPPLPLQRAVIPLGVHLDRRPPAEVADRGQALRRRLGIGPDEVVGLYFGRLDPLTKSHPTPMFRAFELAQRRLEPGSLRLLMAGQFPDPRIARDFALARGAFCPSVPLALVDGNAPDARDAWAAADFFESLSDNVQESFGLTPIEAAAAGLPCVVSDWDGYRDTVIDGETGLLVPTLAPPPGAGTELADALARNQFDAASFAGVVSQSVAVDIDAAARAVAAVAGDAALRRRLGEAGRRRAATEYDWRHVVRRYVELFAELAAIRAHGAQIGARAPGESVHPDYPDPYWTFREHPTRAIADTDRVTLADRDARFVLRDLRANPIHVFGAATLLPAAQIDAWLEALADGPRGVAELVGDAEPGRALRTLLWLSKYGLVTVQP
jgi:starch synthase